MKNCTCIKYAVDNLIIACKHEPLKHKKQK